MKVTVTKKRCSDKRAHLFTSYDPLFFIEDLQLGECGKTYEMEFEELPTAKPNCLYAEYNTREGYITYVNPVFDNFDSYFPNGIMYSVERGWSKLVYLKLISMKEV